jgi:RTX calcium-binding nonapeptide repeat (4 copies)
VETEIQYFLMSSNEEKHQGDQGRESMNRLYILLTVMVVMVGALFSGQEALAEVFTGTDGNDTLVGTERDDRLDGRGGDDEIFPVKATTMCSPAPATILYSRAIPAA